MTKLYKMLLFMMLFSAVVFAQKYTISGVVSSVTSGEKLYGANLVIQGTTQGTTSDENGRYSLDVDAGSYTIICSYIGYKKVAKDVTVNNNVTLDFSLRDYQFTLNVEVIADRAKDRETPVAFTDIDKRSIQDRLGSRDIPLVMNNTPSVYATDNGGGAGDARINVRGFTQRNVAIMINGIPVNDMENGWVYWSNWDGLGDVTSSIQIQRGLSAVNLATPSIGGTVNIITDPTQQKGGVIYQDEFGTAGFSKHTLYANTGLVDGKFALSIGGVKKAFEGYVQRAWTDAYAYYLGTAYQINDKNRLELYAMGAPQSHGQRTYRLNIATFSHELAEDVGYSAEALADPKLREQGLLYNSNWSPVSTTYQAQQWERSYWNQDLGLRHNAAYMNERVNYFHKPLVNLNWYSQLSKVVSLYSTVYWSGGQGGGSGTFGYMKYNRSLMQQVVDWDATIANNLLHVQSVDFGYGAHDYIVSNNITHKDSLGNTYNDVNRGGILRNSVNNQWTWGAISKAYWKNTNNLTTSFGLDWRTAEIHHYRDVRDLLGNDFYYFDGNDFDSGTQYYKKLGDKIDYNNTNTVNWWGAYAQGEYTKQLYTLYATAGYSVIKYDYVDHFKMDAAGNEREVETDWIGGYQFKGGASYRLTDKVDLFANAGYVSKVPIFDQVINDVDGTKVDNPKNEKFLSFEAGINSKVLDDKVSLKLNGYFTNWTDRAQSVGVINADGSDGLVRLDGIDAQYAGIEFEGAYFPVRYLRFDLAFSQGFWQYTKDVSGTYISDFATQTSTAYTYYLKDIKVGDAPQTQLATSVTFYYPVGLQTQFVWRFYANYYSDFDPFSRTDPADRGQVWKVPSYNIFDLHMYYRIPNQIAGMDVSIFAHVFNLFNALYVQDATDNSSYNAYTANGKNHSADDAEVFLGLPTTFNAGFRVGL